MIDILALLGVIVGFALSVTGLLGAQAQPVPGGRPETARRVSQSIRRHGTSPEP